MERNDFMTLAQFQFERLKVLGYDDRDMERNDIKPPPVKFPYPG